MLRSLIAQIFLSPSLAYLKFIRNKSSIHSSTRRTHSASQDISQFLQHFEIFAVLHSASAGHHHARRGQVGACALAHFTGFPFHFGIFGRRGREKNEKEKKKRTEERKNKNVSYVGKNYVRCLYKI
jgi:hypothetical protein